MVLIWYGLPILTLSCYHLPLANILKMLGRWCACYVHYHMLRCVAMCRQWARVVTICHQLACFANLSRWRPCNCYHLSQAILFFLIAQRGWARFATIRLEPPRFAAMLRLLLSEPPCSTIYCPRACFVTIYCRPVCFSACVADGVASWLCDI